MSSLQQKKKTTGLFRLIPTLLFTTIFVLIMSGILMNQSTTASDSPGFILSGSNTVLNPDGGDFMSSLPLDDAWTITSNEYTQFEEVAGTGGVNQPWQRVSSDFTEPTGLEDPNDTRSGGSCGNSDITTDADGGNDYAYYSIIDPDGALSGDEMLAVAVRVADKTSGGFAFSILIDADGDCTLDSNTVCGNPCFEYEMLMLAPGDLKVINIDGCAGIFQCDSLHGDSQPSGNAYICNPCNEGTIQVVAGSGACTKNSLTPVFWMAYVHFSQLPGLSPTDPFRLVPTTTTSTNSVIYKGTNTADIGGIGDPSDSQTCDCTTICADSNCSSCFQDCAFACAATDDSVLPLEWAGFSGMATGQGIELFWSTVREKNNDYFEVERLGPDQQFVAIGQVAGSGNTESLTAYSFRDPLPSSTPVYRIRQVDFNGQSQYSPLIEVQALEEGLQFRVSGSADQNLLKVHIDQLPQAAELEFQVLAINGSRLYQQVRPVLAGSTSYELPVGRLPRGVYLLRLTDQVSGQIWTKKFQLQ